MSNAPPQMIVRFERTIAPALAAAAASAPSIAGTTLAFTAFAFDDVVWAATAGFAAAALLRRANRAVAAVVMTLAALRVCDVVNVAVADAPSATGEWRILVAGTALSALIVGLLRSTLLDAVLWLLCVASAVLLDLLPDLVARARPRDAGWLLHHVALGAGALVAARFASRRRDVAAFVALLVTAAQFWYVRHVVGHVRDMTETVTATVLLDTAIVAGAFAADLDEGTRPDAGAGLVVILQRRPWIAGALMAFAIVGLSGPWAWRWYPVESEFDGSTIAPLVPVAFAFLAHAARGGAPSTDRLAPWASAGVASVLLAYGLAQSPRVPLSFSLALGLAAAFTLWPLAAEALVPGSAPGDATPFAAFAFPATMVALPPLAAWILRGDEAWSITAAICLLLTPIAFHAVVRSRQPSGWILMVAGLFGAAWQILLPAAPPHARSAPSPATLVLGPAAWLLAGLLVVAARRCRSMTAVPLDHPVVADFGGANADRSTSQ